MGENRYEALKHDIMTLLDCPICLKTLTAPERLPCGHSFCGRCLDQVMNYTCPNCRAPYSHDRISPCLLSTRLLSRMGLLPMRECTLDLGRAEAPKIMAKELLELEENQLTFPSAIMKKFARRGPIQEFNRAMILALGNEAKMIPIEKGPPGEIWKRCKHWPYCFDEGCPYQHPWNLCFKGEFCSWGSRCLYIHPIELMNACFDKDTQPAEQETEQTPENPSNTDIIPPN